MLCVFALCLCVGVAGMPADFGVLVAGGGPHVFGFLPGVKVGLLAFVGDDVF